MIRLVQRKLILPRGDTGSFTIPVLPNFNTGDIAVFAIFNPLNKTIVFKKQVEIVDQKITIQFSHNETVNLPAGKYLWDIKAYINPVYANGELVNGDQIDSYYAGYKLPECQIKETSDNYLLADDAPTATLSSAQLDIISAALAQLRDAVSETQENISHYPVIIDEEWHTWDNNTNQYVGTGVRVPARISDLIDDSGHYIKPADGIPADDIADGVIPDISIKADKVSNATSGNFASLDAQGNLIDSGHKHSDYLTEHQDISGKQDVLTFDDAPQLISNNPVKSSGLWNAFNSVNSDITFINSQISSLQGQVIGKQDLLYFDTQPKANSSHPVTSSGIKTAIDTAVSTKQDILTFDATPTQSSNNPVTSGGIKNALSGLEWSLSERANMIDDAVDDLQDDIVTHTMDISLLKSNVSNLETNKQNKLTFDSAPTANSINPVTSGGVYEAITNIKTMSIHICTSQEYNSQTGVPTIASPDTKTFYLVPGGEGSNLYIEWVYINNAWEQFGSATIDLSGYALLTDIPSNISSFTNDAGYLTQHQDISGKQNVLTFDEVPTANSNNPVKSNGIKLLIDAIANTIPRKVSDLTDDSGHYTKPNGGIPANDLADGVIPDVTGKQDLLLFDARPTLQSSNPVTSNGIKQAIDTVYNQISGETDIKLLGKVDRVSECTEGNFAALDENGNLVDSGNKASDFVTGQALASALSGKQDVLTSADKYEIVEHALPPVAFPAVTVQTAGRIVNYTTGSVNVRASCDASVSVDISSYPMIRYSRVKLTNSNQSPGIAFYDKDHTFIEGSGVPSLMDQSTAGYVLHDIAVPTGAKYARFTMLADTETYGNFELYGIPGTFEILEQKADKVSDAISGNFAALDSNGNLTDSGSKASDFLTAHQTIPVTDVQVNGTSVLSNGVANIPVSAEQTYGVMKNNGTYGVYVNANGFLQTSSTSTAVVKAGTDTYRTIKPSNQHEATFYGLAKAAGDATQSVSDNAVGTYTDEAKSAIRTMLGTVGNADYASSSTAGVIKVGNRLSINSSGVLSAISASLNTIKQGTSALYVLTPDWTHGISFYGLAKAAGDTTQSQSNNAIGTYTETAQSKIHEMLDAPVTVSGTDPVITGKAGIRYICGECDTLTFTAPANGIIDIIFESGTTPTVLSAPSTIKWPDWFSPDSLETSAIYEINIMNGTLGAVGIWT